MRRGGDGVARTIEQLRPDDAFQFAYGDAERGLAQVKPLGGAPEAPGVDHRHELLQLPEAEHR